MRDCRPEFDVAKDNHCFITGAAEGVWGNPRRIGFPQPPHKEDE